MLKNFFKIVYDCVYIGDLELNFGVVQVINDEFWYFLIGFEFWLFYEIWNMKYFSLFIVDFELVVFGYFDEK